ncbi:hypothetical protein [Scatolibacter rhodanostii]|uniref:hypothetical protein n=1 Tax=Scatolibacter rhodanostii TaxID=2014781 RepID=UPI000C0752BE|nr:hypothetical protein [Scatolibacter rhodanostii]
MRYLKIDNGTGKYSIDGATWVSIDKINRDDLYKLLELAISSDDFEMDVYDKDMMANPSHQIIYSNIYKKFEDLTANRRRFVDESELLYKSAIEKYSLINHTEE